MSKTMNSTPANDTVRSPTPLRLTPGVVAAVLTELKRAHEGFCFDNEDVDTHVKSGGYDLAAQRLVRESFAGASDWRDMIEYLEIAAENFDEENSLCDHQNCIARAALGGILQDMLVNHRIELSNDERRTAILDEIDRLGSTAIRSFEVDVLAATARAAVWCLTAEHQHNGDADDNDYPRESIAAYLGQAANEFFVAVARQAERSNKPGLPATAFFFLQTFLEERTPPTPVVSHVLPVPRETVVISFPHGVTAAAAAWRAETLGCLVDEARFVGGSAVVTGVMRDQAAWNALARASWAGELKAEVVRPAATAS